MDRDESVQGPAVLRLRLSDFRSYRTLGLDLDSRPVVLTGANGAGKTNILEALSFLAPGRGLRRARISEVARRDAGPDAAWAVAVRLLLADGTRELGTGREAGNGERRALHIDGKPTRSQSALAGLVALSWLTPSMDRLFIEGASGRRRFLDRLVLGLDPAHAKRAAAYTRALEERSRLLKEGRRDPEWLDALEATMAEHGVALAQARLICMARLNQACRQGIGPFPAASMSLAGEIETWLERDTAEDVEVRFRDALAVNRVIDAQAGGATLGPHRGDLRVRHAGKDVPAEQCSTGEQKAVLVAIVLGHARLQIEQRGQSPMLLLDEIAAHLDSERREALFAELCALPGQSWLTGTDEELFAPLRGRAQMLRLRDGAVVAA